MRVASPPVRTITASTWEADSRSTFTRIMLLARYPVMVALPVLSGAPYCGCRLTVVVLMPLRSTPASTSASMTAFWRSLVWFIAVLTSVATDSIPASVVNVSGTPRTSPEPMTVTWRGYPPTGPGLASQAEIVTQARLARVSVVDQRAIIRVLRAVGMIRTLSPRDDRWSGERYRSVRRSGVFHQPWERTLIAAPIRPENPAAPH